MRFPFGNKIPGPAFIIKVITADFLEFPHFFDADEEAHVLPDCPGIVHEALSACSFTAKTSGARIFAQFYQLGAFFFRHIIGVVSVCHRIPDGKDDYFFTVGLFLKTDIAVVKIHGAKVGAGPRAFLADSKLRMKSSTNPTEKESSFSEECVFHLEIRSQDLLLLLK